MAYALPSSSLFWKERALRVRKPSPVGPYARVLQTSVLLFTPRARAPSIVLKRQHLGRASPERSRLVPSVLFLPDFSPTLGPLPYPTPWRRLGGPFPRARAAAEAHLTLP